VLVVQPRGSLSPHSSWIPHGFLDSLEQDREHALVVSYALETPKNPFYTLSQVQHPQTLNVAVIRDLYHDAAVFAKLEQQSHYAYSIWMTVFPISRRQANAGGCLRRYPIE